jgi:hypothetical protein
MKRITLAGTTFELSESDYWELIRDANLGAGVAAEHVRNTQVSGFGDILEKHALKALRGGISVLEELIAQVEDTTLKHLFQQLAAEMVKFYEINDQLVEYVAHYFGMPTPQKRKDRRKLLRKMDCPNVGAVWIAEPGYDRISLASYKVFEGVQQIVEQINSRIAELEETD